MVRPKTEHTTDKISGGEADGSNSLLTAKEVARRLKVHINTVRRWSDLGILRSYRIGPRHDRRFLKEHVDRFIRE